MTGIILAIIHMLLLAGVVMGTAMLMPPIKIESFGSALKVAILYSVLNWVFYYVFGLLAVPFVVITLGLAVFVFNTFLLWVTDKILDDFEIESLPMTLLAAVIITIGNMIIRAVIY
jgi:putative membrane protein